MDDDWDDYADDWNSNQGVILYADHTFKALTLEIDLKGLNILDFGCGTGNLTEKMSRHAKNIIALDTSVKMIEKLTAKELSNVTALHLELTSKIIKVNAALSDNFDLITASSVFAFVVSFEETLKLLKNALASGGTLVQWDWLAVEGKDDFGFSPEHLKTTYVNAGFKEIKITQPFALEKPSGSNKVVMVVAR